MCLCVRRGTHVIALLRNYDETIVVDQIAGDILGTEREKQGKRAREKEKEEEN